MQFTKSNVLVNFVFSFYCHLSVPPSIDFVSHNTTVNETDDVTLFCNSTGNPRPNVTWLFLSGAEPRDIGTRETLTLTNVTRNQAGIYQCMAANKVMNSKTANVRITINC